MITRFSYIVFLAFLIGLPGIVPSGFSQNALDFDGSGDRGVAANASALITNGNFSMGLWVKPTNANAGWPDFDGIAGFRNDNNADFYFLQLSSTSLEARLRNNGGIIYDIVYPGLNLNSWNHFLATYDQSFFRLYHDGVIVDSIAAFGVITNATQSFYLGMVPFSNPDFELDGQLDDVCLWNRALSPSEVNAWYNACTPNLSDPGLQLCYEFNQGTAGGNNSGISTATDSKGNINATLTGFSLNGNASNFIAYGNPSLTNVIDSATCTYLSPSGNYQWTSSAVYLDTLLNTAGCDSILSIDLTITGLPLTTINPSVCNTYTSPSGNYVWDSTGVYADTLAAAGGCDSIISVNLTVNQNSAVTLSDSACFSYLSPSGNFTWTSSGTYLDTLPTMAGCDSLLTVNLTINTPNIGVSQNGSTLSSNAVNASYQWVNCDSNFALISGATSASFTPPTSGNFAVIVTQNACVDTSACTPVVITSRSNLTNDFQPKIHPNPHSGQFIVQLPQLGQEVEIRIFETTGKTIQQLSFRHRGQVELELDAPTGLYFVEVMVDGRKKVLRMVKR